jgi:4-aminobutyrate aminotransferase-like enzyme
VKLFEVFERDRIIEGAAEKGIYFLNGLEDLARRHPSIGHIDGLGLYLSIELVKDRKTKEPAGDATAWATGELVNEGVLCMYSGYYYNRLCFAPPLVIQKAEIDLALQAMDRVLAKMENKFGIPAL